MIRYLAVLLGLLLMISVGCGPPPTIRTSGADSWAPTTQPTHAPGLPSKVTVLGETIPDPKAVAVLRKAIAKAQEDSLEDRALTLANLGISAAHMGALDEAATALGQALLIMEALIYDPKKSQEIASLPGKERTKIFKGEPHERALCNAYRGLLFLASGDAEAARACFLRGDLGASGSAGGGAGDGKWLSLEYLAAVADYHSPSRLEGQWLREVPEELQVEPYNPGENILIVIGTGLSPVKLHKKGGKEHGLAYARLGERVARVELTASEPVVELSRPTEDMYLQAVSNGRRQMDALLAAKQEAADTSAGVADAAEVIGAVAAAFPYGAVIALPSFLVGTISRGLAAGTDATAELRCVVGPGRLYIATASDGGSGIMIRTRDATGNVLSENVVGPAQTTGRPMRVVLVRINR